MEIVLPHVAVQVVTLWDTGSSGCVLGHTGTVHKAMTSWSLDAAGFPTRGRRGCLRKGFVPSEPTNQLIKKKAELLKGICVCVWGGGGKDREESVALYVVDRGQKFFFFTEGNDRDCNKKEFKLEMSRRIF